MTASLEAAGADSVLRLLAQTHGVVRVRHCDDASSIRMTRYRLGPLTFDRTSVSAEFDADVGPADLLVFGRVEAGRAGIRTAGRERWHGPGDHYLAAAAGQPRTSKARGGDHEQFILPGDSLTGVTDAEGERRQPPGVRLLGLEPARGSEATWRATCDYVRDVVLAVPDDRNHLLLATSLTRLLVSVALTTFPNTALIEPTIEDRHDAHPATLRRAVAYIDENAYRNISPRDVADSCFVTIRALQLVFRRHLNTTPGAYLRRVRMEHARRELITADPAQVTVGEVALRWGFANHSRFAAGYRAAYGTTPSVTLRSSGG